MSFLGVAVFVGLRNSSGTMLNSLDKYYDATNHYDIRIISTLGLTEEDIKSINELGTTSYGIHSKDVITNFKKGSNVTKIIGINNNINKVLLNEGTLPKNDNEIVVEKNTLTNEKLKIGDYIEIEKDESLKVNKFKIVGVVSSPLYLFIGGNSMTRGNTNIGNGKVEYYAYVKDSVFNMDYYTELNISINNDYITSSKEYTDLINEKIKLIKSIKSEREKSRYKEIIEKYDILIKEKEELGRSELSKVEDKLNESKKVLDNGYSQLESAKKLLDDSKYKLDQTFITLNNSKVEIQEKEKLLENAKIELENGENEINELLSSYGLTIDDIETIKDILNDQTVSKERLKHIFSNSIYKDEIYELIDKLYETDFLNNLKEYIETKTELAKQKLIDSIPKDIENYDEIVKEIELFTKDTLRESIYSSIISRAQNIDEIKEYIPESLPCHDKIINLLDNYANTILKIKELFDGVDKIKQGKEEIANGERLLLDGKNQLEQGYKIYYDYLNQYNDGLSKYNSGYNDYKNGLNLYNYGLEQYLKNKVDFENEIEKAKKKLSEIEMPKWFIYDRSDDSEYSGFVNNSDSVKRLASAFPTVFFLVAIFMCIMSMSRMALEDRGEIGTLKSLGFSNKHIILKYVIYSILATILGSILGGLFGFYFLTWFIFKIYGMLYYIPFFVYQYNIGPFIGGTIIAVICITGTAILTVKKIVNEKPLSLLRPMVPSKGNKIFIEYIPIWKKISFSNKITIRNIVRYKKRVIMTVLGIAGCTILLLTGYGIKDSIITISDKQFGEVYIFDEVVYLDSKEKNIDKILNTNYIKNYEETNLQTVKVKTLTVDLHALKNDLNYDVINITDYKTHEKLYLENNKVIITDKLSTLYNYKVGDKIKFIDTNNKTYKLEISGIANNYVGANIFMNIETYEKLFEEYKPNVAYINLKNIKEEEKVAKELMKNEHILSVISKNTSKKNIEVMLQSLDNVVLILVILSGMLSFVVLYNLSYINISERKREIATLKVLGFTHSEVDNYIIKENFIITIIGILIGLLLAKPFVDYIVNTVEIELVRFIHIINISSYLCTFTYMILFTCIVTVIIHFTLKKIDMIESLKTVE